MSSFFGGDGYPAMLSKTEINDLGQDSEISIEGITEGTKTGNKKEVPGLKTEGKTEQKAGPPLDDKHKWTYFA